jgi:hypothetical protein
MLKLGRSWALRWRAKRGSNSSPLTSLEDEVARRSRDGEGVGVRRYFGVLFSAPNLPCHCPRHGFRIGAALVRNDEALGVFR